MSSNSFNDVGKWEAFRLVKADDAQGLQRALSSHQPEAWSAWRNFAGKTLYQVAEKESWSSGKDRCLKLLHQKLQDLNLEPQQVHKVDYIDRVVEQKEYIDKVLKVPVDEVHYHKTLRHVPELNVTEVQEVRQVERYTVKEELQVMNELVEVPKEVIHTTIKEIPDIKHIVEKREETTDELMPFSLSTVDRVTELHTVDVLPKVQFVAGEKNILSPEYEQVSVPYELYVPQTEVNYIDRQVVRQVPISVPNVKEHAVIVRQCEEREVSITQKDYEVTQYVKHVPKFPMRTEWVPKGRGGATIPRSSRLAGLPAEFDMVDANNDGVISPDEFRQAGGSPQEFRRADADRSGGISRAEFLLDRVDGSRDGVVTRAELDTALAGGPVVAERCSADVRDEMWHELHLLRFKCAHLGKVNAYLEKELVGYRSRTRELGETLSSEKQLRQEEEERQLKERQRAGTGKIVMSLKPLPVRTDSCPEADRVLSPNTSTFYRSAHETSVISSIGSPHISTDRAN